MSETKEESGLIVQLVDRVLNHGKLQLLSKKILPISFEESFQSCARSVAKALIEKTRKK